jgi:hypothetical protein
VEPRYTGRYVVRPGREHAEIVVVDPAGHHVAEHELPIDATGNAATSAAQKSTVQST